MLVYSLCKNYNPPEKGHPLFPINPPLKTEILSSPPFLKIGTRFTHPTSPPAERGMGVGVHTIGKHTPKQKRNFLLITSAFTSAEIILYKFLELH